MRKKKNQVHQPDDHFFKEVMSRKSSVAAYLQEIHPQIANLIDLDSLKISKDSFLSPDLETFTSDIIWHSKFKNSEEHLNLALLFEHR